MTCQNISSGPDATIAYQFEDVPCGTPVSTTFKELRRIGEFINLTKTTIESDEVNQFAQYSDVTHGTFDAEGSIPIELSDESFTDMISGVMNNDFIDITPVTDLDIDTGGIVTRNAGDWIADGFMAGIYVTLTGFVNAENNYTGLITAITTTTITVVKPDASATIAETDVVAATTSLAGKFITVGVDRKTFAFENRIDNKTLYQNFKGCEISSMELSASVDAKIDGTFGIIATDGSKFSSTSVATAITPAPSTPLLKTSTGAIYVNGVKNNVVSSISINIENMRNAEKAIGNQFSVGLTRGRWKVTGSMSTHFDDDTLYNHFYDEDEVMVSSRFDSPDGTDFMSFSMNRTKFNTGNINPPNEGVIPVEIEYQGLLDTSDGGNNTTLVIQSTSA